MQGPSYTRREALRGSACGFGWLAAAAMAAQQRSLFGNEASASPVSRSLPAPHFAPKAKRVIFIFMQGGPSHVDSFDYKPALIERDGEKHSFFDSRQIANKGMNVASEQRIFKPQWAFKQYGQTGSWVSDLFPAIGEHVDDLCFLKGMHTEGVAHGPATLFLHCGSTQFVRPSIGSWIYFGLGTENENLPGFVSIAPSGGNGGPRNYGNAFLPPSYQGEALGKAGAGAAKDAIANLVAANASDPARREELDLLQELNRAQLAARPGDEEIEAVIESYDLAWRMQSHAPEVFDFADESEETLALYGIGTKETDNFGRRCLLARRLAEEGVRYIQVTYGDDSANPAWDQHSDLPKHATHAKAVDRPVAGLLADLKRRGLLEDTLVWWGGEFGRTPYSQSNGTGRDHNPEGFTVWLAGGGVKPGFSFGETDEFGHRAIREKVHMHDLHATILHLLGLDHERLTYRYAGRDFRLTDVYGRVVKEIMA